MKRTHTFGDGQIAELFDNSACIVAFIFWTHSIAAGIFLLFLLSMIRRWFRWFLL